MSEPRRARGAGAASRIFALAIALSTAAACSPHAGPAARVGPRGRDDLRPGGRTRAVVAGLETDDPPTSVAFSHAVADYEAQLSKLGTGPASDRIESVRGALDALTAAIAVLPLGATLDLGDACRQLASWSDRLEGVTPSSREGTEAAKVYLEVAAGTLREAARGPYRKTPRVRAAVDAWSQAVDVIVLDRPLAETLGSIEDALRRADAALRAVDASVAAAT